MHNASVQMHLSMKMFFVFHFLGAEHAHTTPLLFERINNSSWDQESVACIYSPLLTCCSICKAMLSDRKFSYKVNTQSRDRDQDRKIVRLMSVPSSRKKLHILLKYSLQPAGVISCFEKQERKVCSCKTLFSAVPVGIILVSSLQS